MRSDYIKTDEVGALIWGLTKPNKLVCEVVLQTGWRVDDVLSLERSELERALKLKRPTLCIKEKKTGKRSRKTVPRELIDELYKQCGARYVFEGRDDIDKHRSRQAVYMDLKRTAKRFGVKINLSPHSLRKNYAVYICKKYGFERCKKELNHENDFVTMLYAFADQMATKKGRT